MKIKFLIFFYIVFISTFSVHPLFAASHLDQLIINIDIEVAETKAHDINYKKVTQEIKERTTEGGEAVLLYKGKDLQEVILFYFGETGKLVEKYYFKNKQLIFVETFDFYYSLPISMQDFSISRVENNKYYFHQKDIFYWIDPNKQIVHSNPAERIEKAKKFLEKVAQYTR